MSAHNISQTKIGKIEKIEIGGMFNTLTMRDYEDSKEFFVNVANANAEKEGLKEGEYHIVIVDDEGINTLGANCTKHIFIPAA